MPLVWAANGTGYVHLIRNLRRLHFFRSCVLALAYVLCVPCSLAAARLLICTRGDADVSPLSDAWSGARLAMDPSVACNGGAHLGAVLAVVPATALAAIATVVIYYRTVQDAVVYDSPTDHNKALQRSEIEWELELNDGQYPRPWPRPRLQPRTRTRPRR